MASLGRFPIFQALFGLLALGALVSTVACNSSSTPQTIYTPVPNGTPTPITTPNPNPTSSVIIIIGAKTHRLR